MSQLLFHKGTEDTLPAVRSSNNLYFTTDTGRIFLGDKELCVNSNSEDIESINAELEKINNDITDVQSNITNLNIKNGSAKDSLKQATCTASDDYASAFGYQTKASKGYCHAEGNGSEASNTAAHAEGKNTVASGLHSHAEGYHTTASGGNGHAEGARTIASGDNSHAEGEHTAANGNYSHAEGNYTEVYGDRSHIEGFSSAKASSVVSGLSQSTSEDTIKSAWANNKFAVVLGNNSHGEGKDNLVLGAFSHAEGRNNIAGSDANDAWYAHAEGKDTKALGNASHAEGLKTEATGAVSHAEGSQTIASGNWSHAEGALTEAQGDYSHASGTGTIAKETAQFVCGAYNAEDSNALFIVGAAQNDSYRANCLSTGRYSSNGESYIKIGNTQLITSNNKLLYNNSELATKADLSNVGGGTITSVNGQTGPEVTLDASDVGAVAVHNEGNIAITSKDAYNLLDNNILSFVDNSDVSLNYKITLGGVAPETSDSVEVVETSIEGTNINICPAASNGSRFATASAISVTAVYEYSDAAGAEVVTPITQINGEFKLGNTTLTETQLQAILNLLNNVYDGSYSISQ